MSIPESLKHRIELFAQTGRVFRPADGLFAENSWVQVLMGQGVTPLHYHPVADRMGMAELTDFMGGIRRDLERRLQRMPEHHAYVARYCGAGPVRPSLGVSVPSAGGHPESRGDRQSASLERVHSDAEALSRV